ncbi:hypothetical protein FQN60_000704 [Etheostoma spectabile]|uniref:Uncharacterized protein n=1 Tax=Etheostoma spectabile TaxID=54343 RepID=A0A5J5CWR4_9PERO|nr:hypothetical protein FQN60_000704 [Etheostoma spectabile]
MVEGALGWLAARCQVWIKIGRKIHQQAAPLASCCQLRGLQVRQVGVDSFQSVPHPLLKLPGRVPDSPLLPLPSSGNFQSLSKVLSTFSVIHQGLCSFPGLFSSQPTVQRGKVLRVGTD